MGLPFRVLGVVPDTDVSEAPEGFLDNFEDGGSGVLDPLDGVRTLKQITTVRATQCLCDTIFFQAPTKAAQNARKISISSSGQDFQRRTKRNENN